MNEPKNGLPGHNLSWLSILGGVPLIEAGKAFREKNQLSALAGNDLEKGT